MDALVMAPLSAFVLWLAARYIENKFRFQPPKPEVLKRNAPPLQRLIILHNRAVRVSGLALVWMGTNVLAASAPHSAVQVAFFLIALIGMAVYVVGLSWDLTVAQGP